jgi:hypothetical protein
MAVGFLLMAAAMAIIFSVSLWRGKTWFGPNRSADRTSAPTLFWTGQAIIAAFGLLALLGAVGAFVPTPN